MGSTSSRLPSSAARLSSSSCSLPTPSWPCCWWLVGSPSWRTRCRWVRCGLRLLCWACAIGTALCCVHPWTLVGGRLLQLSRWSFAHMLCCAAAAVCFQSPRDKNNAILAAALIVVVTLTCIMSYMQERSASNVMGESTAASWPRPPPHRHCGSCQAVSHNPRMAEDRSSAT